MDKARVAVLMGGMSSEHEVSLRSGANAVKALEDKGYPVLPVTIGKDGRWRLGSRHAASLGEGLARLQGEHVDCAFLALHGAYGEDGRIQGLLDLAAIPYTGSGHAASAIAIDKVRSKAVVSQAGIRVARQVVFTQADAADAEALARRIAAELGFPCVLKSPCQGSSLGMAIPRDSKEFMAALEPLLKLDAVVLAEQFLSGPEVTCGVLDVDGPRAMPVTEIRPVTSEFFDYHAKYTPGATQEITPAEIPEETARRVQEVAVQAHRIIGCSGLSRSDMILVNGEPVWLEVNTIPGMTETSLFPQAAAHVGISLADMVEMLVEAAMAKSNRRAAAG